MDSECNLSGLPRDTCTNMFVRKVSYKRERRMNELLSTGVDSNHRICDT